MFKGSSDPFRYSTNNGYRIPGSKEIRLESLSIAESCGVQLVCTSSPVLTRPFEKQYKRLGLSHVAPSWLGSSGQAREKGNRRKQIEDGQKWIVQRLPHKVPQFPAAIAIEGDRDKLFEST